MADDLTEVIAANAAGPAKVSGDTGSMEQHNLKDLIEAERFRRECAASANTGFPCRIMKIKPPGAV